MLSATDFEAVGDTADIRYRNFSARSLAGKEVPINGRNEQGSQTSNCRVAITRRFSSWIKVLCSFSVPLLLRPPVAG
jgi:hypothetical protein